MLKRYEKATKVPKHGAAHAPQGDDAQDALEIDALRPWPVDELLHLFRSRHNRHNCGITGITGITGIGTNRIVPSRDEHRHLERSQIAQSSNLSVRRSLHRILDKNSKSKDEQSILVLGKAFKSITKESCHTMNSASVCSCIQDRRVVHIHIRWLAKCIKMP